MKHGLYAGLAWLLLGCSSSPSGALQEPPGPPDADTADTGAETQSWPVLDAGMGLDALGVETGADATDDRSSVTDAAAVETGPSCSTTCQAAGYQCGPFQGCDCGTCSGGKTCGDNGKIGQCGDTCAPWYVNECTTWNANNPTRPVPSGSGYLIDCTQPDRPNGFNGCETIEGYPGHYFWCCP